MTFCTNCGHELSNMISKFCSDCGFKQSNTDDDKDNDQSVKGISDHLIAIAAFIGGITFTGMILVIQSQDKFKLSQLGDYSKYYSEGLIVGLSIISFLLILGTLGFATVSWLVEENNKRKEKGKTNSNVTTSTLMMAILGPISLLFGVYGIFIILPLLLLPFSLIGSIVLVVIEILVFESGRIIDYFEE